MTPRELGGWVPTETHKHYDAAGAYLGETIVERESRIDDVDRTDLLALLRHDAEVCACGFHPSVANDEGNDFSPGSRVCPVCEGASVWSRVLADGDEKAQKSMKDVDLMKPRPWDGRVTFMRMLPPGEGRSTTKGEGN